MTRPIKFRAWNKLALKMVQPSDFPTMSTDTTSETGGQFDGSIFMQFTCLLDKNGKEIYEGDVVKKGGKLYKVGFYSGQFNAGDLWNSQSNRTWEIIGNIYSNPELLK